MPYLPKWVEAGLAVAYVMKVESCNKFEALRQLDRARFDGALRTIEKNRLDPWRTDTLVHSGDLRRLWPLSNSSHPANTERAPPGLPDESEAAASPVSNPASADATIARPPSPAEPASNQPEAKRVWQASDQEPAAASDETRADAAEAGTSSSAANSAMDGAEAEFVRWMTDEKERCGSYPPRDRSPKMQHTNSYREWAKNHSIRYKDVERWARAHNLHNPQERPRKA